jgi:hypothetical protein
MSAAPCAPLSTPFAPICARHVTNVGGRHRTHLTALTPGARSIVSRRLSKHTGLKFNAAILVRRQPYGRSQPDLVGRTLGAV